VHCNSFKLGDICDLFTKKNDCARPALAGLISVLQLRPSVWNSKADYLRDLALELYSFRRQLKTFLFAHY